MAKGKDNVSDSVHKSETELSPDSKKLSVSIDCGDALV